MASHTLKALFRAVFLVSYVSLASEVQAERYVVGIGDQISVDHTGVEQPLHLIVDADGQVRLSNVGGITVAGLTLDQAETGIEARMEENGYFVNPAVSLSIVEYAPVIVGGDVVASGRFAYVPGMTIASALALSGGGQASGLTRPEIARARAEVQAGLRNSNLEIAVAVSRLARFQAQLAGPDVPLSISAEQESRIPSTELADLERILRNEAMVLKSDRARAVQLISYWDNEIETILSQGKNFDARIAVQQQILDSAAANLEAARDLTERGLQTSARLVTAEQRDADAKSRVLELEAAKIAAARAISSAQRERVVFLANQERDAFLGIQEMNTILESASYKYQRFQEQLVFLTGSAAGSIVDIDTLTMEFDLQSSRSDRPAGNDLTLETSILPGETLIVRISPIVDELDG